MACSSGLHVAFASYAFTNIFGYVVGVCVSTCVCSIYLASLPSSTSRTPLCARALTRLPPAALCSGAGPLSLHSSRHRYVAVVRCAVVVVLFVRLLCCLFLCFFVCLFVRASLS